MKIKIDAITPNPDQPRKTIDPVELSNLAENIRKHGLLQPITVEQAGDGYILIAGERRWRAHQLLGREDIEAIVTKPDEKSNGNGRFLRALAENMQRSNLSVMDEAQAIARLSRTMTQQEIAREMNLSVTTVISRQLFLKLEPEIQQLITMKALPFEYSIAQSLLLLPADVRVSIATRFAQRGASAKWIKKFCKTYDDLRPSAEVKTEKPVRAGSIIKPDEDQAAFKLAAKRAQNATVSADHYNALAAAGIVPPWPAMRSAVERECRSCDLYNCASEGNCKTCPLVGVIVKLVTNKEK